VLQNTLTRKELPPPDPTSEIEVTQPRFGSAGAPDGWLELGSWLPLARRANLVTSLGTLIPRLQAHRRAHQQSLHSQRRLVSAPANPSLPAWTRVSATASEVGSRLIVGFRNHTCRYRQDDPLQLGCFNCGFYAGVRTVAGVTPEELQDQLRESLHAGFRSGRPFDVLEFLSDGSFLNDAEFDTRSRAAVLECVPRLPYVRRLLIESVPAHVSAGPNVLTTILRTLRPDQDLEIGIGLETADDFIRKACINKGFLWDEFEGAVATIAGLPDRDRRRCAIVAYLLVKPALLSSAEAVDDVVATLERLEQIARAYRVKIVPKLEPAAISDGTMLSLLYAGGPTAPHYYAPVNYWAVLEILARTARRRPRALRWLRIGAREDMDDVLKMPAVYTADGRYDRDDFVLYYALQQFNRTHDLDRVLSTMVGTRPDGRDGLLGNGSSLLRWVDDELGQPSDAAELLARRPRTARLARDLGREAEALRRVYPVLDAVELLPGVEWGPVAGVGPFLLQPSSPPADGTVRTRASVAISAILRRLNLRLHEAEVFEIRQEPDGHVRLFFDLLDFILCDRIPVWAHLSTKERNC